VATNAKPHPVPDLDRAWLLRALLVLQSPRAVFAALRDDSEDAARARQEPVMALVWLAGIASVLATPVAGRLFDDPVFDGILVVVWAFLGGGLFGVAVYWAAGALLHLAARPLGTQGSYRRARHVLAFAAAPLALALLVYWPIRIAVFGGDLFRSGGSDGGHAWASVFYVFVAWALVLVVVGVRTVHGWSWPRAFAAAGLAAAGAAVLIVPSALL
jgi:hypothetical protein